jgi:hypothetical protein
MYGVVEAKRPWRAETPKRKVERAVKGAIKIVREVFRETPEIEIRNGYMLMPEEMEAIARDLDAVVATTPKIGMGE